MGQPPSRYRLFFVLVYVTVFVAGALWGIVSGRAWNWLPPDWFVMLGVLAFGVAGVVDLRRSSGARREIDQALSRYRSVLIVLRAYLTVLLAGSLWAIVSGRAWNWLPPDWFVMLGMLAFVVALVVDLRRSRRASRGVGSP